ncbi:Phage protein [Staphylococcus aureus]|nr:Phage protein [Staphylococcus aureus]
MNELTKEQKYTIAKFYKLYIERSNNGETETVANFLAMLKMHVKTIFAIVIIKTS